MHAPGGVPRLEIEGPAAMIDGAGQVAAGPQRAGQGVMGVARRFGPCRGPLEDRDGGVEIALFEGVDADAPPELVELRTRAQDFGVEIGGRLEGA